MHPVKRLLIPLGYIIDESPADHNQNHRVLVSLIVIAARAVVSAYALCLSFSYWSEHGDAGSMTLTLNGIYE